MHRSRSQSWQLIRVTALAVVWVAGCRSGSSDGPGEGSSVPLGTPSASPLAVAAGTRAGREPAGADQAPGDLQVEDASSAPATSPTSTPQWSPELARLIPPDSPAVLVLWPARLAGLEEPVAVGLRGVVGDLTTGLEPLPNPVDPAALEAFGVDPERPIVLALYGPDQTHLEAAFESLWSGLTGRGTPPSDLTSSPPMAAFDAIDRVRSRVTLGIRLVLPVSREPLVLTHLDNVLEAFERVDPTPVEGALAVFRADSPAVDVVVRAAEESLVVDALIRLDGDRAAGLADLAPAVSPAQPGVEGPSDDAALFAAVRDDAPRALAVLMGLHRADAALAQAPADMRLELISAAAGIVRRSVEWLWPPEAGSGSWTFTLAPSGPHWMLRLPNLDIAGLEPSRVALAAMSPGRAGGPSTVTIQWAASIFRRGEAGVRELGLPWVAVEGDAPVVFAEGGATAWAGLPRLFVGALLGASEAVPEPVRRLVGASAQVETVAVEGGDLEDVRRIALLLADDVPASSAAMLLGCLQAGATPPDCPPALALFNEWSALEVPGGSALEGWSYRIDATSGRTVVSLAREPSVPLEPEAGEPGLLARIDVDVAPLLDDLARDDVRVAERVRSVLGDSLFGLRLVWQGPDADPSGPGLIIEVRRP